MARKHKAHAHHGGGHAHDGTAHAGEHPARGRSVFQPMSPMHPGLIYETVMPANPRFSKRAGIVLLVAVIVMSGVVYAAALFLR